MQVYDWRTITQEHGPRVWQTVYRLLHNEADAADCFQETFVAAFELSQRQSVRNMQGLLVRLATTRAIDRLRQRSRSLQRCTESDCQDVMSQTLGPAQRAQNSELAERLRRAIAELPEVEAKVFCLRHFSEMSYRQIAGELRIKTNAAGVLLHRAKAKLREYLATVET